MNFLETNYSSDFKSDHPKRRNVREKFMVKISEQLEKISPLDFRSDRDLR